MNRCLHDLQRVKNPGKDYALIGLADNEVVVACTKCKEWFIYTYRTADQIPLIYTDNKQEKKG